MPRPMVPLSKSVSRDAPNESNRRVGSMVNSPLSNVGSSPSCSPQPLQLGDSVMPASTQSCGHYIVRNDGTLKFLRNPLSFSAPTLALSDHKHAALSRSKLLSPLAPSAASTPVDTALTRIASGQLIQQQQGANLSPQRSVGRGSKSSLTFEQAAERGKLAPQDADIQRIAKHGMQIVREEDGGGRLTVPTASLGLRQSALVLEASLHDRMDSLQKKADQMSRFEFGQRAQRIFNDVVYELIRQIGVQCADRSKLLASVWVRSSEIINALAAMFLEEQERHAAEEQKLKDELRASRKDYLVVVARLEEMVEQEFQGQSALLEEGESREAELAEQISRLKDELHTTQAQLQRLQLEQRLQLFQKVRPLPNTDAYGLEQALGSPNSHNAPPEAKGADGKGGAGGPPSPPVTVDIAAPSITAYYLQDGDMDHTPDVVVSSLKAELQRQRVLLIDASSEIKRLRGEVPCATSCGVQVNPDSVEKGLDPCEELMSDTESSSGDDSEKDSKKGRKQTKGKKADKGPPRGRK